MDNVTPNLAPPPPPVQTEPVHKASFVKWLVIVVAIAALSSIATLIVAGSQLIKQSQPTPTPTPLPAEASAKAGDETANWETYTDMENKYSVKFPDAWGRGECPAGTLMSSIGPEFKDNATRLCATDVTPTVSFSIRDSFETTRSGGGYITSSKGTLKAGIIQADYVVVTKNEPSPGPEEYMEVGILDSRNNKYIVVTLYDMKYRATLEKILSTFTFIEPSKTAKDGCVIGGCNNELCLDKKLADEGIASVCVIRPEFVCYKDATCEKQTDGTCGWTQSAELQACLKNPPAMQ